MTKHKFMEYVKTHKKEIALGGQHVWSEQECLLRLA